MAAPSATPQPSQDPHTRGRVTDPVTLRAVAHPMRLKLIGMVGINGTLTASQAAKQLDSTPAVTAYHLRTLAKYGFVEDAGSTSARERPWRLTERAVSFSWSGDDPAGQAMTRVAYAEWFEHVYHYEEHLRDYPQEVRDASSATERVLFATPEEVAELTEKIRDLLEPFEERVDPARRPPGVTTPMEVLVFTHPLPPQYSPRDS